MSTAELPPGSDVTPPGVEHLMQGEDLGTLAQSLAEAIVTGPRPADAEHAVILGAAVVIAEPSVDGVGWIVNSGVGVLPGQDAIRQVAYFLQKQVNLLLDQLPDDHGSGAS